MSYEFVDTAAAALATGVVDSLHGVILLEPFTNAGSPGIGGDALFVDEGSVHADILFADDDLDVPSLNAEENVDEIDD